jgi:hypothetical protein
MNKNEHMTGQRTREKVRICKICSRYDGCEPSTENHGQGVIAVPQLVDEAQSMRE